MKKIFNNSAILGVSLALTLLFGSLNEVEAKDVYACTSHGIDIYVMHETISFRSDKSIYCKSKRVINGKLQGFYCLQFYTRNKTWVYDEVVDDMVKCIAHPVSENYIAKMVLYICNFEQ